LVHGLDRIGRTVQHAICGPDDLSLHQVAEAGWNPIANTILASGEHTQHSTRYAFVIENSHNGENWGQVPGTIDGRPASAGVDEAHDLGPVDYAHRVLARRFAQLHRDDTYDWQDDSWYRCSVWDIAYSVDYRSGTASPHEAAPDLVAQWLKANGCAPHAVEVRTPTQVARDIEGSNLQSS
jgi:hypothetical protein